MAEPFIGEIKLVGFNFPPRGWASCDGQILSISSNSALFSLLGTTYGGDGRTTFALPDLRGRDAHHVGNGPGLNTVRWGERGGANNHTMTVNQMPTHTHGTDNLKVGVSSNPADTDAPANSVFAVGEEDAFKQAAADTDMHTTSIRGTIDSIGSGQTYSITNPFLGIYHVIALVGIFPSRS